MTQERAIRLFQSWIEYCAIQGKRSQLVTITVDDAKGILELIKEGGPEWKPFIKRPLTEDEQKNHPEWCFILDGDVPDDEEEILLYRPWSNKEGYIITMDTYMNNGDTVYLDGAGDIENGMYWMHKPMPPKEV